jgi:hypothetical protein
MKVLELEDGFLKMLPVRLKMPLQNEMIHHNDNECSIIQ